MSGGEVSRKRNPKNNMAKSGKQRILIISHDKIGSKMAGPGIRYHYMAEELASTFDVTVGFFDPTYLPDKEFEHTYNTVHIHVPAFEKKFKDYDVIIALFLNEAMIDFCNRKKILMIFDMYAPVPVENLAKSFFGGQKVLPEHDFEYASSLTMYRRFFENGDLFLCSNQRQLDFWIGYIFGADQIRLSTYAKREIYERFIYAPMGIDTNATLKHTKDVIKGVMPGIKKTDTVLLWTGGIWGWYDGKILMRAMKQLQKKRPDIKLVFFGTQHPNPAIPEMKESYETRKLAEELGLLDKTVFFNHGWVPYGERINYLLEADVAVNTHKASIETEFSHRTRVLDHILTRLPSITTEGDYLSDISINLGGMGLTVPADDEEALVQAILNILEPKTNKTIRKNIENERNSYGWTETMKPLREFLLNNPTKLERLPNVTKLRNQSLSVRLIKRAIPVPVKKMIIRARNYGA